MCPPTSENPPIPEQQPVHVREAIPDLEGRNLQGCDVEYGERPDDGALVFHFFPPGYALDSSKDWPSWTRFRDALEAAIMRYFDYGALDAGYASELKSFHLIVRRKPSVPDLTALIEAFFTLLEDGAKTEPETTP